MAFTVPQPSKTRPAVVTAAVVALYVAAASEFATVFVTLAALGKLRSVYERLYAGMTEGDMAVTVATATTAVSAGFALIVGIGWVVLAILDGKAKNPARIVTWVLGGLFLCCNSIGLVASAAGSALTSGFSSGSSTANAPTTEEITNEINDALPWYTPTTLAIGVVFVLALLLAVILLALPAANAYFRKTEPQLAWEPPLPQVGLPPQSPMSQMPPAQPPMSQMPPVQPQPPVQPPSAPQPPENPPYPPYPPSTPPQ